MSAYDFALPLLQLPRNAKRAIVLSLDALICIFSVWFALYLRLGELVTLSGPYLIPVFASLVIAIPIFVRMGLYRAIYRYSGINSILIIVMATALYGVLFATIFTVISVTGVPRTIGIIQPILVMILVVGSRTLARLLLNSYANAEASKGVRVRILIYGAGQTGRQLSAALAMGGDVKVVGFVDDDPRLTGSTIDRRPIYSAEDLPDLVKSLDIAHVVLALPDATRAQMRAVVDRLRDAQVSVQTLPDMAAMASGKVTLSDVRPLSIDDLLGRDPVAPDVSLMQQTIKGKSVAITGAGGSIGAELCRQICTLEPAQLILIEQSEYSLYAIHQELEAHATRTGISLIPLLGSVTDGQFLSQVFAQRSVDTVFHAAAYKHVPLVEQNVAAGIRNNVWGTCVAAEAAAAANVSQFVLVSTDKAVRPTNFMGASKRLAELVLQAFETRFENTRFSMVRFGNVLGSSGSVVPRFRKQIEEGGPVTLTHPEITRFFMSIPEAAQLVVQSSAMARGGDVFVLDMGEAVKILDLAERMIELSGLTIRSDEFPEGDIEIQVTGLRPGEKLYEELLLGDDPQPTRHERIMRAQDACLSWDELEPKLNELDQALAANDIETVRRLFVSLPLKYGPNDPIADLLSADPKP
ncbi:polysaccharide biosynthesis protein [Pontivivens insulae]|uniref:UDP-N-acetyl-alpha-D-glucosamine C6 dehydratase n=1 Tax=Pontivivens insulae TaxID=1639689 RepID=A0A2R8AEI8_9RHOB|nr:nucleoside-diphosphate sugar epimerase/dehydratase [Pontivivens insulae]RED11898.1 FlaA1/EpsC-like NDP-sugar epimerase [Pontivivens insulae]SPF30654.1 UDP-N-acetyl-alpha-D-glucosamine C6 dehydratase [Pontivivens insulae]